MPLSALGRSVGVDLLAHARQEGARDAGGTRLGSALVGLVHLESDLVELRDWVAADLTRSTVLVGYTLGTVLEPAAYCDGSLLNLANDKHRRDNTRDQALEDDGLVVVDRDGGAVDRVRDRVRWGRRVVGMRRRRGRSVETTGGLGYINNVHDKRV